MAESTVYDSVFKTMMQKTPELLIPFVNEVFGRDYPSDAVIVRFSDEHEGAERRVIDDSVFRLGDKIYHIECQSTPDTDMVVRMIEYDFAIALDQALANGKPYRVEFPASCVLFLRHNSNTPDALTLEVVLPDGRSFDYETKVVKAQLVGSDELFEKHLLILLPYYLMRYEEEFDKIADDNAETAKLLAECESLRAELASQTLEKGDARLYEWMVYFSLRVSNCLLANYEPLQVKVKAALSGKPLGLFDKRIERIERVEREAREAREKGLAEGREEGRREAMSELVERLSALGVDKATIDEAIASMKDTDGKDTSQQ